MVPLPFGFDIAQLLWSALIPLVFFLLLRHKKRLQELLGKALAAYGLAWITYEVVRAVAFPRARDGWLVLGMKTFVVFLLLELAWGKIHPARDEEIPTSLVLVLYIVGAKVALHRRRTELLGARLVGALRNTFSGARKRGALDCT